MFQWECRRWLVAVTGTALFLLSGEADASQDAPVDVELVLAADISPSMDEDEQQLQRDGYVAAFRHPEIIEAIKTGPHGRIAVTYLEWAGENFQRIVVPWTLIDGAGTALQFAEKLAATPIKQTHRTSISGALIYATGLFDSNGYQGRRVIDVSGRCTNNQGVPVELARDAVVERAVTINGLPLLPKPGSYDDYFAMVALEEYFEDCVIGGSGAFIIPVRNHSEFVPALRRKLMLEIAEQQLPAIRVAATPVRARTDCLTGQ
jgi:hypothetical protein